MIGVDKLNRMDNGLKLGTGARASFWFEEPGADVSEASTRSATFASAAVSLRDRGLAVLEGVVPEKLCDRINKDFERYCRFYPYEAAKWVLSTGLHSRLTNFHLFSDAAKEAIFTGEVAGVLDALFGAKMALCSSLYFEQSTEQAIHRDSPFFCTNPYGRYFGVWIALEDIRQDAGPLKYIPGGHRVDIDRFEIGRVHAESEPNELYGPYITQISEACSKRGLEIETVAPRKGDVVIWHPELPHGGGKISNPGASRKSIVYHVMPDGVPVFGPEVFFGRAGPAKESLAFVDAGYDRRMFDQGSPAFAHNY